MRRTSITHRYNDSSSRYRCPNCGGPVVRVKRRARDRLMSLVLPLRRFQCTQYGCEWEGNLSPKHAISPSETA